MRVPSTRVRRLRALAADRYRPLWARASLGDRWIANWTGRGLPTRRARYRWVCGTA